jgi:hypothetical protein
VIHRPEVTTLHSRTPSPAQGAGARRAGTLPRR